MRRTVTALVVMFVIAVGLAPAFRAFDAAAQPPPPSGAPPQGKPGDAPQGAPGQMPPGGPGAPGQGHEGPPPPFVFNQAHADTQIMRMLEHIKGKEDMPAESVYKNIQIFKGMPAKRIAPIMVLGFSRSLGVRCSGCHVRDDFASDDKANKKTARAMWAMQQDINKKYLPDMKDLETDQPVVACWTCHRGNHEPEVNAPAADTPQPAPQPSH